MSEFHGKTLRTVDGIEDDAHYTAVDVEGEFGPSVELRTNEGEVVLTANIEAFRSWALYELVTRS